MMYGWIIIIVLVIIAIWYFGKNGPGRSVKRETPLDILKKRFAAGEITKEEYEDKKAELENH